MVEVASSDGLNNDIGNLRQQCNSWSISSDEKLIDVLSKFSSYIQNRTRDVIEKVSIYRYYCYY